MATDAFAIFQGPSGPTAVTNPVQRQILAALTEGDKQLPELVEITGRSKPTLSGSHMKELLNRELVIELPHPSDSRRKVYRLNAKPLGSSQVPVDQLRSAVQAYARSTGDGGISVAAAFQVLAAAPPRTSEKILRSQAHALGRRFGPRLQSADARGFAMAFTQFAEQEGLAEHLQLDFEALSFRCRPGGQVGEEMDPARAATLLAGFAEGAASAIGLEDVRFDTAADDEAFRLSPR